jgi:hypothetical protein
VAFVDQIEAAKSELANQTARVLQLTQLLSAKQAYGRTLKRDFGKLKAQFAALSTEVQRKHSEFITFQKQARIATVKVDQQIKAEISRLSKSLAAEKTQTQRLNSQVQSLSLESKAEKAKLKTLESNVSRQEATIDGLQKSIATADQERRRANNALRKALGIGPDDSLFERVSTLMDESETLSCLRDRLPPGTNVQTARKILADMTTSHKIVQQIETRFGTATTQTLTKIMNDPGFPVWYARRMRRQMYVAYVFALGCALFVIFR